MELKTSEEWAKEIKDFCEILDPDGWDRTKIKYSWQEEKISKKEFCNRLMTSTCQVNAQRLAQWSVA